MTEWVNAYVGIPYVANGADRTGVDCYGLLRLVAREQFGSELPEWYCPDDPLLRTRHLTRGADTCGWKETPDPAEDFTVVAVRKGKVTRHCGISVLGGVLHADKPYGVTWQPLDRFRLLQGSDLRFYKWPI